MTRPRTHRRRLALGLVPGLFAAMSISAGSISVVNAEPVRTSVLARTAEIPAWDGSVDLYRAGTFTTQHSWLWCTAAGVQIIRNIAEGDTDHSAGGQRRYFDWMRAHNRYDLPESAGVDPAGWTAGLRRFVDDRYRLVASASFDGALRLATKRLRATGLPGALTVAEGGHGWIMTGFSATADPLVEADFEVKSVRIVGPLWGLQSRAGYDMKPGTSLTPNQLRQYFTPWRYAPKVMIWDGRYVSIQPVPASKAGPTPTPPKPPITPTVRPMPTAPSPVAAVASPSGVTAASERAGTRSTLGAAASPGVDPPVAQGDPAGEWRGGDAVVAGSVIAATLAFVAVLLARRQRSVARSPRTKE